MATKPKSPAGRTGTTSETRLGIRFRQARLGERRGSARHGSDETARDGARAVGQTRIRLTDLAGRMEAAERRLSVRPGQPTRIP